MTTNTMNHEGQDSASPTACVLLIGNELLSGKTQDSNLQYLGSKLAELGVRLAEARVLPDDEDVIVATLNECRKQFDYVFTTGGIGPTHDDITAQCIAAAFGRELILDEEAVARLRRGSFDLNEARLKMALVPDGATLIDNPLSNAPGFRVENVFVLAGIPSVARAMFETIAAELAVGTPIHSRNVDVFLREGDIAEPLERIAAQYPDDGDRGNRGGTLAGQTIVANRRGCSSLCPQHLCRNALGICRAARLHADELPRHGT